MIKANLKHKNLIVAMLSGAFNDNQSVNYIVRQDEKRLERIAALMDYSFEMCSDFGEIWLSENQQACALILFPHLKKLTFRAICLDIKLIFKAIGIGGIAKTLKRESKIKTIKPKKPMVYLWFIGVNPATQHLGNGTELLKEVIDHANALNLPVYLETSTVPNIPWYQNLGFQIYETLDFGFTLYFLKRGLDKL